MKRDKSYYGRIAKNTQRAYYFIEHQGRSPWNYHVHAIGVWCEELSDIAIVEIKTEWRRVGGSSGKIDKPWEDDPYRKLRYILKPSYGNRGNGRKTKSTDRCLNQDLFHQP
jgi:hypothetical protein